MNFPISPQLLPQIYLVLDQENISGHIRAPLASFAKFSEELSRDLQLLEQRWPDTVNSASGYASYFRGANSASLRP